MNQCISFQPISRMKFKYDQLVRYSFSTFNLGIDRFTIGHGLVQVSINLDLERCR